jgi:integrase
MSQPRPRPSSSTVFDEDEPVIQSHPLLPEAQPPRFGDTGAWNLNGVIARPARLYSAGWTLVFSQELTRPPWNLLAREVSMVLLNPRHPAVTGSGMSLKPTPAHPSTVIGTLSNLRRLARWASEEGAPAALGAWQDDDLRRFISDLSEQLSASSITAYVRLLKSLHQYGPVLTGGGLRSDPWIGKSARVVSHAPAWSEVSTPAIPPELWFPLIRAARAYVHTFAPDILRAQAVYHQLRQQATSPTTDPDPQIRRWLADVANPIPIHAATPTLRTTNRTDPVNWSLLMLRLGWHAAATRSVFDRRTPTGRRRIAHVTQAIADGHPTTTGVTDDLVQVHRQDGTSGPWHPGLDPIALNRQRLLLRDACFVLVVGLSMMRDSEIHEITRGSIVDHYGTPAIASTKRKQDPNLPTKHWWITEPVAEAVTVAEQLSPQHGRIFPPLQRTSADVSRSHQMLDAFISHTNATRTTTGLNEIPAGRVRPHMFRRTMAMLTDQFAGSEIALGIQLKHVATRALANRSTQGYAAADSAWADHLDSAIDAARFRRLEDLYQAHKTGQTVGYGPAADRLSETFNEIQQSVKARDGDATIERSLLRQARISLRFGSLNHCAFDENDATGALCLEEAIVPPGHTGPLPERCRPDRCRNSIIGAEHLPIWNSEKRTLLTLLDTPGLPAPRVAALHRELTEVGAVLAKADKDRQ